MPLRYVVPDTCAIAASLYNEIHSAKTDPMLEAIRQRTVDAVSPSVGLPEFFNVSRKKLDARFTNPTLLPATVDTAVIDFMALPITWIDVEPLAAEAWRLHRNYAIETNDAFFVAVAVQFSAEIWTIDTQFAASTSTMPNPVSVYDLKSVSWK